jgi:hypothetical protein
MQGSRARAWFDGPRGDDVTGVARLRRMGMVSLSRHTAMTLVASALLMSWGVTACGPRCPTTIRAGSSPVDADVPYPDTCFRSGDGAVDFDGQYWVAAVSAPPDARNDLQACSQAQFGDSPQPAAPPATLMLTDQNDVRWSDGTTTFLLVSAGRTEAARCG